MEGKNFFSRAIENTFKKPERERTVKECFKALSKDEIELNFRISRLPPPAYREHLLINCAQKKLSLNALKYVEVTSPESAPPLALIEEVKLLIKTKTVDNALRLLALTPNIYGQATNLMQKTLLREQGYLGHAPNAEVEQKMLGEAFWKIFDGEYADNVYKNRCWRSIERRYFKWLQKKQLSTQEYENILQTEAQSGSMPSRVREYLAITSENTHSDETRLVLLKTPSGIELPTEGISSSYKEMMRLKRLSKLEKEAGLDNKIAEFKKIVNKSVEMRSTYTKDSLLREVMPSLIDGNFSATEISSVPELTPWIPEEEVVKFVTETTAYLAQIKKEISTDQNINQEKILGILQKTWDVYRYDNFLILRELLTICRQKPHFFDGLDVDAWTSILRQMVPDRHCRSFVIEQISYLYESGNLTPEIAQIFLFRHDDDLLAELWEKVGHDTRYASIFLGYIEDRDRRDSLHTNADTKVIDMNALEKILASAESHYEKHKKILSLEKKLKHYENLGIPQKSDPSTMDFKTYHTMEQEYAHEMRSYEQTNTYLAEHLQDVKKFLDQKISIFFNRRPGEQITTSSTDFLPDIAVYSLSTHDIVAEKILEMIAQRLTNSPTPTQADNRYEKLLTALIVRGSSEQQTLVAEKMSDYMGLYGLGRGAISIIKAWRAGLSDPEKIPDLYFSVAENLWIMRSIEKKVPGGCKILLEEFGIKNFARYGENILLKQLEEKGSISKPYGIILFPEDDWNGAFSVHQDLLEKLSAQLSKAGILLRITEAKNGLRAAAQTEKMKAKYNQASFCFAGGHGTEDGLALGSRSAKKALPTISRTDLKNKRVRRSGAFLKDGSQIILISCSTGKDGGFAQKLSEAFGRAIEVIGPNVPTNIKSIKLISTNPIRFEVEYSAENTARGYAAGTAL